MGTITRKIIGFTLSLIAGLLIGIASTYFAMSSLQDRQAKEQARIEERKENNERAKKIRGLIRARYQLGRNAALTYKKDVFGDRWSDYIKDLHKFSEEKTSMEDFIKEKKPESLEKFNSIATDFENIHKNYLRKIQDLRDTIAKYESYKKNAHDLSKTVEEIDNSVNKVVEKYEMIKKDAMKINKKNKNYSVSDGVIKAMSGIIDDLRKIQNLSKKELKDTDKTEQSLQKAIEKREEVFLKTISKFETLESLIKEFESELKF